MEILHVKKHSRISKNRCKPRVETKSGTFHILENCGKQEMFEWTGKGWSTPNTGFETSPYLMKSLGWIYYKQDED